LVGLLLVGVSGCGEEPPPPPPAPPPAPPPVTPPSEALVELEDDPFIQWPTERTAGTFEDMEQVVDFVQAFASGDRDRLMPLLGPTTRENFRQLYDPGEWGTAFENVEAVRVNVLSDLGGTFEVGIGLQEPDGAYLTGWMGGPGSGGWEWEAVPVRDIEAPRVAGLDLPGLPPPESLTPGLSLPDAPPTEETGDGSNQPATPSGTGPLRPGRG